MMVSMGTKDLDSKSFKLVLELDTDLESGLATEGNINSVRALVVDDLANEFGVNR